VDLERARGLGHQGGRARDGREGRRDRRVLRAGRRAGFGRSRRRRGLRGLRARRGRRLRRLARAARPPRQRDARRGARHQPRPAPSAGAAIGDVHRTTLESAPVQAYLDLVRHVLDHGVRKPSRTGVDTLTCFAAHYQVDLAAGFPLLTTKKMHWGSILRELLWYLSGEDHIRNLREHTKIWDAWADEEGRLDTAYGHYWRHFPSATRDAQGSWQVREIDQIENVLHALRTDPTSRRMVVTAWE